MADDETEHLHRDIDTEFLLRSSYEVRTEVDNVARRQWTCEWWDEHLCDYDAYTSEAVIEELEGGSFPGKANALELMEELPLLDINEPIILFISRSALRMDQVLRAPY